MTDAETIRKLEARVQLLEHWLDKMARNASGLAAWGRCYCDKEDHSQCSWSRHTEEVESRKKLVFGEILKQPSLSELVYPKGHYHGD